MAEEDFIARIKRQDEQAKIELAKKLKKGTDNIAPIKPKKPTVNTNNTRPFVRGTFNADIQSAYMDEKADQEPPTDAENNV